MTTAITKRLSPTERTAWRGTYGNHYKPIEPGLGSVADRLTIIIQRQGGRVGMPRSTNRERADYLAWLDEHDPEADRLW